MTEPLEKNNLKLGAAGLLERGTALQEKQSVRFPVNLSIVLPAYNEEANLAVVTESAVSFLREHANDFEIIIVNDGSSDGTGRLIRELRRRHPEVKEIEHPVNRGYGASLRDGFAACRHEWLFFTDSDHQFRIDSLLELLPLKDRADIIVGFRKNRQDLWTRLFLSWGYNLLMRLLFKVRVRDIDCAFKLLRKEVLDAVEIESDRFFVNTELLVKAQSCGLRIAETGVDHFPRQMDRSKVSLKEIPRTLREVARIWKTVHKKGGRV